MAAAFDYQNEFILRKEHDDTVAKWDFKNVILLNSATNYRQLVPNEHYVSLYSGSIPEGVFIDLAFCKSDPIIEWRQTPGGLVIYDYDFLMTPNISFTGQIG